MKRGSSPCRDRWAFMVTIWTVVACLITLSLPGTAQTTTRRLLVERATQRLSDFRVSFTYGPAFPSEGQTVHFVDASTGEPTSWKWDFGDGSTSTRQNPSHQYSTSGFRTVSLVASNGAGSKRSIKTIAIMPAATPASFAFSPTTPGPGQTVQFADTTSGGPTSWQWDFGDGSTSNAKNPSHVFLGASSYTVKLVSSGSFGSKQASKTITVASASVLSISFTYAPALPTAGQTVQFTGTAAGSPSSWRWDFGDGTSSTSQNPAHAFSAEGSYSVTLSVANASETKSTSRLVTVSSTTTLGASFTYSPTSPVEGRAVLFTDNSLGSPTSWLWDFGDGTTSTSRNPNHTYASTGSYDVILKVTSGSSSDSLKQSLNVLPDSILAADFTYGPASPVLGRPVSFSDASTGGPTSWEWDFGDSATSTLQNPSHTYAAGGAHSITLTVKSGSNSSSISKTISVTYSDVIQAASPSYADVVAAISTANAGDTVLIPAGKAIWKSQLVITKGIKLIGAGAGNTVITSGYVAPTTYDSTGYIVAYLPASPELNEPFRLSGFTFDLAGTCQWIYLRNNTAKAINQIRIDHNDVSKSPKRMISIKGAVYGVIDNNVMAGGLMMTVYGSNATSWNNLTFDFGTADNIYFEDNTCTISTTPHDGGVGGRYCARYNKYIYINQERHLVPWFDMHGNGGAGKNWSGFGVEVYENVIDGGSRTGCIIDLRGGKGLIYNNTIKTTSRSTGFQKVREEFLDAENHPASSPISKQPQHVSDTYFWGNNQNGYILYHTNVSGTLYYSDLGRSVPQANADFWDHTASFDGTSGMGVGPLADRPATGVPGVGYWATDVKKLFRWTVSDGWKEYYAPYAYPHPLRDII